MEELVRIVKESAAEGLYQMILSNPVNRAECIKMKVRPVMIKGQLRFQTGRFTDTQVFHVNYGRDDLVTCIMKCMEEEFRQIEITTTDYKVTGLVSKKGKVTIKKKQHGQRVGEINLSHNRSKNYILEEGRPVPFLVELGVQTPEGRVVKSRYDKFRQINRYLEFISDVLPALKKDGEINIIDFGCGKSYLTFALYYYLHELKKLNIRVTGLDLKREVIAECSRLAERFGFEKLTFLHGDIAQFEGAGKVDMVVTLHACDTATDYALMKAIDWNAGVILSVPCCQHEVNRQIASTLLEPMLQYGLLKERAAALFTDAVRAGILEEEGYETQILEFIDMEHTPKNILIRAVKTRQEKRKDPALLRMTEELGIRTTLQELVRRREGSCHFAAVGLEDRK